MSDNEQEARAMRAKSVVVTTVLLLAGCVQAERALETKFSNSSIEPIGMTVTVDGVRVFDGFLETHDVKDGRVVNVSSSFDLGVRVAALDFAWSDSLTEEVHLRDERWLLVGFYHDSGIGYQLFEVSPDFG